MPILGGTLMGQVTFKGTGEGLAGVRVAIESLKKESASGENGVYSLTGIPEGAYTVRFSFPGYRSLFLDLLMPGPEETVTLDAQLEIRYGDRLEQVRVTGQQEEKPVDRVSRYILKRGDFSRLAGSVEDVGRQLTFLPSLAHVSDLSNDLMVRGGSPFENGYYIDNIPITSINHFQREGAGGGVIGIINPDMIEETEFHVGAFPARYGDRLSSIMDLHFREGRRDHMRYQTDLNAAGFSLSAEGPLFGDRAGFICSLRRSYLDLLAKIFSNQIVPRYGDLHIKADWQPGDRDHVSFLTILGDSSISYDLQKAVDLEYNSYIDNHESEWTAGVNWQHSWSDQIFSNTSFSISHSKRRDTLTKVEKNSLYEARREEESHLSLRSVSNWVPGLSHAFEFGFELLDEKADFYNSFAAHMNRWGEYFPGLTLDGVFRSFKAGLFVSWQWHPSPTFSLDAGVRADYFSFNDRVLFSPRMTFTYAVSDRLILRAAAGLHRQQLYPMLLARNPTATGLNTPSAQHLVLGAEFRPDERTWLTCEIYRKEYHNLPLSPDEPTLFVMDNGVALTGFHHFTQITDSGRARSVGIEVDARRQLGQRVKLLASMSFFRSRYQDISGVWRNRLYDNRLLANLAVQVRFKSHWEASLRWSFAGGTPYSPYDAVRSAEENFGIVDDTRIMGARYPPYHSLSLRLDRTFVFSGSKLYAYINVLNAYNRENVARYYWSTQKQAFDTVYQVGFIPVIGCRYEF